MRERRERDLLKSEGGRSYKSCSFGSELNAKPPLQTSRHLAEALTGSATSAKEDNHRPRNTERYLGKLQSSGLAVTTVSGGTTNAVLNWMKTLTMYH